MISRRFFLAWTARFTRAIGGLLRGYRPRRRFTCFASGPTTAMPEIRRLCEPVFLTRKWLPVPLRRRTLPLTVTLNRFAAPRCVLSFGMLAGSFRSPAGLESIPHRGSALAFDLAHPFGLRLGRRCVRSLSHVRDLWLLVPVGSLWPLVPFGSLWPLVTFGRRPPRRTLDGCQHHDHVAPVELRVGLYGSKFFQVFRQPVQQPSAQLGVGHLPAPEHDGHLDPGSGLQEPLDVALLRAVVVAVDLRAHLDLLDLDARLLLPGLFLPDVPLVFVLAVVHDPADGRLGHRRHFHQVQVQVPGTPERVV